MWTRVEEWQPGRVVIGWEGEGGGLWVLVALTSPIWSPGPRELAICIFDSASTEVFTSATASSGLRSTQTWRRRWGGCTPSDPPTQAG